jgi:predicted nucleotidyltransferase
VSCALYRRASGLAYDTLIDEGLYIQPWPVRRSAWEEPALHHNPHLIKAMRRDAKALEEVTCLAPGSKGHEGGRAMTPAERKALDDYTAAVRRHYGTRLVDILVFGSRARGDARSDSDVDLAVILEDGNWKFWDETMFLSDLGYDAVLDPGLWIQAWPVSRSVWEEKDLRKLPFFVIGARPEAKPVSEAV